MAEKYCDHGAYGVYAATPTWGAAQDGDGTAKTIGTPSTAAVVFTGIASTGVIAVLGQTITFTRVTDANTCANNLAAAINASTAVATGPASFTTLSQVRNHVFARGPSTGAPAGTCQIMTRQASASHAGLIAITHTLNNVSSPATINFSGGTGGCWGYLLNGNNATIWPSDVGKIDYGCMGNNVRPFTGVMSPGDVVNVRAKTLRVDNGLDAVSWTPKSMGSRDRPVVFKVDDSTLWADGLEPVLEFIFHQVGPGYIVSLFGAAISSNEHTAIHMVLLGKIYASGKRSVKFRTGGNVSFACGVTVSNHAKLVGVEFSNDNINGEWQFLGRYPTVQIPQTAGMALTDCKFWVSKPTSVMFLSEDYGNPALTVVGGEVICLPTVTTPSAGIVSSRGLAYDFDYRFIGVKFSGFVNGSRMFASIASFPSRTAIVFMNCDLGGISVLQTSIASTQFGAYTSEFLRNVSFSSKRLSRDFHMEVTAGMVSWLASRSPPHCKATQLDGITGWAIEMAPTTVADNISANKPLRTPLISKINSLAQGARSFSLEIAIDQRLSLTKTDIALVVSFTGMDGVERIVTTYAPGEGALVGSAATWSSESGGFVQFAANSSLHNKFKLTVSTGAIQIAQGSQVDAYIELYKNVPDVTHVVLIDPELTIT